jgi:SAM-dependent methyltransferase
MARRTADSLIFDTLRLEGALFVPALLEKAARGEFTEQKDADYQLPKGLTLADEQGRAFRIAGALWKGFESARERRDIDAHRATIGFISELLRDALGYTHYQATPEPVELHGRHYRISALARGRVAVVVAPHDLELDTPDQRFAVVGSGTRRRSAYQLTQQFLNASESCTWALVTNGRQLRLVRDADTLTRPAYLEFDLELILRDKRYADFAALWRLVHASRAGEPTAAGDDCVWERWKCEGEAQGERVRAGLRIGVTDALLALGDGFLQHRSNDALRRRLESGDLTVDGYFQQLLRLVYRFLFLFTIEERGLIHPPDESAEARRAREAYAQGYALRRLRDRALRRSGFDRFADLWDGVRIVFRALVVGESRLALPALGGLFTSSQCPDLDAAALDNRALLTVMRHLRWSSGTGTLAAVDYRNMGPEELGSVYESLLELVPTVDLSARRFGFVGLTDEGSSTGNARKMSGSYYTPDALVQELLDSALDPVVEARIASRPEDPARALLDLAVVDPACGSGHFLLGAARRIAEKLAEVRAIDGAVQPADYRHALREVIAHCVYGVDRNPMAIELARTALWLEGYEPGRPLSFLDHHLVCGDALLGFTDFKQLRAGISGDAFKPLSGDAKEVCKGLAAENRAALKELTARLKDKNVRLFADAAVEDAFSALQAIEAMPDGTTTEVDAKHAAYIAFLERSSDSALAHAADLVVAAFLTSKAFADVGGVCPTTRTLIRLLFPERDDPLVVAHLERARAICQEARVLHWPLAFAQIMGRGGFDCVLGNPPWERVKLQEKEFFAARHPGIANAPNKAARDRLVAGLVDGTDAERRLHAEFITARRLAEASSVFAHVAGNEGGRFPLTGVGDVNTYALFAETIAQLTRSTGRAGFIVPTGVATDDTTKSLFSSLVSGNRLVSLMSFENEEFVFPAVHHFTKFCLLTLGHRVAAEGADFVFFARQIHHLEDSRRHFRLSGSDFQLINPNTRTCPTFRSQADAELTKKIYRRVPVLIEEARESDPEKNPWGISFSTMFHMSGDSHHFIDEPVADALPLYEAKMMHQFDHRWATYLGKGIGEEDEAVDVVTEYKRNPGFAVRPRYWVREREVLGRIASVPKGVAQAWMTDDAAALLAAFAVWIDADADDALADLSARTARHRVIERGGKRFEALSSKESDWRTERGMAEARAVGPLTFNELEQLRSNLSLDIATHAILDGRSPHWLMGWRDITNATNERTVIASVLPRTAVNHKIPLFRFEHILPARLAAVFLANIDALCLDYCARQKVGGTSLTYHYFKQFPILPPSAYTEADLTYIVPRVLELTYTSHDLAPWAADLGYTGAPFGFEPERRAQLRAELDAYYARLYGLTRDELRYILEPADTHGADYPTRTFHALKTNELRAFGFYRTRDLVLKAWRKLEEAVTIHAAKIATRAEMSEEQYLIELIAALLRAQPGGALEWDLFVQAVRLLAKPAKLLSAATDDDAELARSWMKTYPPGFDLQSVVPALREIGGENLKFENIASKRYLVLAHVDAPASDSVIDEDARVAMRVVRASSVPLQFEADEISFMNSDDAVERALA